MSAGLFELRKDPITGWWVATIVDRDFDRSRFARPTIPHRGVDDSPARGAAAAAAAAPARSATRNRAAAAASSASSVRSAGTVFGTRSRIDVS